VRCSNFFCFALHAHPPSHADTFTAGRPLELREKVQKGRKVRKKQKVQQMHCIQDIAGTEDDDDYADIPGLVSSSDDDDDDEAADEFIRNFLHQMEVKDAQKV
jgi:hypothetical protein